MQNIENGSQRAIDWALCLQLAGDNPDVANELLGLFTQDLSDTAADLHKLFKQKDWEALTHCVHKLHGGACYTGVPTLKEAAKALERNLNNLIDEDKIVMNYNSLQEQIDLVIREYNTGDFKR